MSNITQHETALVSKKAEIGEKTRIWAFVNIQDGAKIGKACNICDGCYIEGGSTIGDNVTIKNGVDVFEGVHIEDDVFCGAKVSFVNDRYPRSNRKDKWVLEEIHIKKGATIGSNATVLCGVTIGTYATVGAGSVVTKDVPGYTIVAGNPAEPKGCVCQCGRKVEDSLACACGLQYVSEGEGYQLRN